MFHSFADWNKGLGRTSHMKKGNTFEYMGKNLGPAQLLRPRKRPISTFSFFKFHSNSHVYAYYITYTYMYVCTCFTGLCKKFSSGQEFC